jgi:hypothetical protein
MSGRTCGDCSLCCKLLEISAERAPEVAKPAGQWCKNCVQPGCSIYDRRPALCRDFKCMWLLDDRYGGVEAVAVRNDFGLAAPGLVVHCRRSRTPGRMAPGTIPRRHRPNVSLGRAIAGAV